MYHQWFKGGITNICYNCLDRNVEAGLGDKTAMFWEGNERDVDASLTYSQLLQQVCQVYNHSCSFCSPTTSRLFFTCLVVLLLQLANYLKDVGVKKGDAVVIYLPMLMELPTAMLACARIGAVHSVNL